MEGERRGRGEEGQDGFGGVERRGGVLLLLVVAVVDAGGSWSG